MATTSIGSGLDHENAALWEADTDNDLVTATEGEIGECHDAANTTQIIIGGATVNATYFRTLRSTAANRYDPSDDSGCKHTFAATGNGFLFNEQYFVAEGMAFVNSYSGAAGVTLKNTASDVTMDGLHISAPASDSGGFLLHLDNDTGQLIRNVIIDGTSSAAGATRGMHCTNSAEVTADNVIVYNVAGTGMHSNATTQAKTCKNCICVSCTTDFSGNWDGASSDNASSDATAPGGELTSQVATDLFTDPANGDFSLKAGSNAIDAGADRSAAFTTDFNGDTRTGTWDMGAIMETAAAPSGITIDIQNEESFMVTEAGFEVTSDAPAEPDAGTSVLGGDDTGVEDVMPVIMAWQISEHGHLF